MVETAESTETSLDPLMQEPPAVPLSRRPFSCRRLLSHSMVILTALACGLVLLIVISILGFVTVKGIGRLSPEIFVETTPAARQVGGGLGNALIGTLVVVGMATGLSLPIGVLGAIYLREFATNHPAGEWIRFSMQVLSGVPSILCGVFAYGVIVLNTKTFSAWAGGIALAVLMLPLIVLAADEALRLVSIEVRAAAFALGATRFQVISRIVLPAALPLIITGVSLAIARAAGETAPLIFTALFSPFWPKLNQLGDRPIATLSVFIYNNALSPFANLLDLAWTAALILVFLVLLTSLGLRLWVGLRSWRS